MAKIIKVTYNLINKKIIAIKEYNVPHRVFRVLGSIRKIQIKLLRKKRFFVVWPRVLKHNIIVCP